MHEVHIQPDGSAKIVLPTGEPGPEPKDRTFRNPETQPESETLAAEIAAAQAKAREAIEALSAVQDAAPTRTRRPRRGEE